MAEERVQRMTAWLARSPALRDEIQRAIDEGRVPDVLRSAASLRATGSVRGAALESVMVPAELEAIVRRFGRPPLLVRDDAVELEPLPDFPAGTDAKIKQIEPAVRSVGRVEFRNHGLAWGGTAWIIGQDGADRVVATNRHVAALVAQRTVDGRGVFLRSPSSGARYGASVDFREEVGSLPGSARSFEVADVVYLADDTSPDVALMRITGTDLPPALPLANGEAAPDDLVALIGYPAYDSRNPAEDQARYFRDLYDVKRFAPGKVTQERSGTTVLMHDCTSLGGNSGSPLISLSNGTVVGLHFAGEFGVNNSAVGAATLRSLLAGERPTAVVLERPVSALEAKDGSHTPAELADRDGYDPGFLGVELLAPWPTLSQEVAAGLASPSDALDDRPNELRYTHFGVLFSKSLRQPVMTAVNIDGKAVVRVKRQKDKWFRDGRLAAEDQLGQDAFDDPQIDRGHMVRREDPNWDPQATSPDDVTPLARQANLDTFHYPNASPQHSTLNQGKQLWQGLENYVLDSARTHGFRACVFSGPVVRPDDPEIKPGVRAPREYWKVVAMVNAEQDGLHATAYLLSQGDLIRDLLERRSRTEGVEGFVLGPYRTFQLAIGDLAEATGYDFGPFVAADPLARTAPGEEAIQRGDPVYIPLETLDNIVT